MKTRFFLAIAIMLSQGIMAQTKISLAVTNTLNVDRNEVVAIPWADVIAKSPKIDPSKIVVTDVRTDSQVPYQLEHKGGTQIQNLLLYATVAAKGNRKYTISEGVPQQFLPRTFCRYVPERKDDFAWENDRIAYRMYGKALENTNENANGTDVWTKYVDYMVIDKWYKLNDYHTDNGEGQDFYKVGFTLGAGDIAPYHDNKIWYSNNYRRWKILDMGVLRSTFRLEYDAWDVAGRQVAVTKTISIDAGAQLNMVEADYTWADGKPLTLVAGVVKRKDPGVMMLDEQKGVLAYWEPMHGSSGTVGVTCIFSGATEMKTVDKQIVGVITLDKPQKTRYYNGAAWDKAGIITNADAWFKYLLAEKEKQSVPLTVALN